MLDFLFKKPQQGRLWLFLDVDGVLNTEADWQRPFTFNTRCVRAFQSSLKELRKHFTEVSIILSSSWRSGWDPANQPQHIRELCREVPVVGITPQAGASSQKGQRGREIRHYLKMHGTPEALIVLDDDPRLFTNADRAELSILFINAKHGFTSEDAKRIMVMIKHR